LDEDSANNLKTPLSFVDQLFFLREHFGGSADDC